MATVEADPGLAKVVVVTPHRQLELALPEHLAVSALLPTLVRHGGDDAATEGADAGGWVLRRTDGTPLDGALSLAAQAVRDGELLHLVTRRTQWPEVQYDDVVDVIAAGARRGGPAWTPTATRVTGLVTAVVALLLVLLAVLRGGGPWPLPGGVLLGLAVLLLAGGTVLSRAAGDAVAGAVLAAVAMPYALAGGGVLLGGDLALADLGAPHLLLGCCALVVAALAGYVGVADLRRVFVAGLVAGAAGGVAAALELAWLDAAGAAAVVTTVLLLLSPALPLLSVRLAKVPLPAVPRDAEDLRASDTLPPVDRVLDQVAHSLELLAGALLGVAVTGVVAAGVLAAEGTAAALTLAGVVATATLLRARMLVAVRQRLPLVVAGGAGLALTAAGVLGTAPGPVGTVLVLTAAVVAAVAALVAGLVFARRAPSPYLGRLADVLDVVLTLAAAPVAAGVLGLYATMRGLGG